MKKEVNLIILPTAGNDRPEGERIFAVSPDDRCGHYGFFLYIHTTETGNQKS